MNRGAIISSLLRGASRPCFLISPQIYHHAYHAYHIRGYSTPAAQGPQAILQRFLGKTIDFLQQSKKGFVDFGGNVKAATRFKLKERKGAILSRTEIQLYQRTKADVFRLLPFSVVLILLPEVIPFIVWRFPNFLPSTFTSPAQKETIRKKTLETRTELAKKMQEGILKSSTAKPTDFVFPEQILAINKKYPGGFLLSDLNRQVLVYTCKFMGISTWAPSYILTRRLRKLIVKLKNDDSLILRDGINRLSLEDLQDAVESRGMMVRGLSQEHLYVALQMWMSISLTNPVPDALLLLSRPMFFLHQANQPSMGAVSPPPPKKQGKKK